MARRTSSTDTKQVDTDGDGRVDSIVTRTTTLVEEVVEQVTPIEEDCPPDPVDETVPVDPRADGDPGECGENPCYQRTPLVIVETPGLAKTYQFTAGWKGTTTWDFGDGTPTVTARGTVSHTYATTGAKTVKATPMASACRSAGTKVVTVA